MTKSSQQQEPGWVKCSEPLGYQVDVRPQKDS